MDGDNGTEVIDPAGSSVQFKGRTIEVRPLTVGQIPGVMRALKGINLGAGIDMAAIPGLIADHGDQLTIAVAIATKLSADEVCEADGAEFLELVAKVLEINGDFFVRQVLPLAVKHLDALTRKAAGAGLTPSKS